MLVVSIFATLLLSASATAGPIKRSPRLHRFGGFQMGSDPWGSVVVYDPPDASAITTTSADTSISAAATSTSVATTIRSSSTAAATTTSLSNPTTTSAEPATTSSDEDRNSAPVHQDFQGNGNWNGNSDWNFSTAYTFSTSFSSPTAVSQDVPSASETTISSTSSVAPSASTVDTNSSSASPSASSSSSSSSAPTPSQSSNSGTTAQGDIDAYLKVHNTARSAHKADDLQWNNTLADAASSWVGNCNFEHSGGSLGPYGENLAEGTNLDASAAVQMWVDEGNSFNANSPEDYASLHFTQVVWAATTQVGCASKSCGDMVMHVCEYFPQGNVLGTFGDNVF